MGWIKGERSLTIKLWGWKSDALRPEEFSESCPRVRPLQAIVRRVFATSAALPIASLTAHMTFGGNSVNMTFNLLVIPFLISSLPDLLLSTLPTDKRLIKIEVWQSPVCVDVIQLVVIGSDG